MRFRLDWKHCMTAQIIATLLPVFLIAACGTLYGRFRSPDIHSLNTLNMEIFVPMLVFAALADRQAPLTDYAGLALAAGVVVLGSGIVLWPLVKLLKLEPKTFLPPMMFNNSGNMGIPLLVLAFGEAALPAAVVLFIVEMLLHFSVGLYMLDPRTSLLRLLRMPIVLASLVVAVGDQAQQFDLHVAVAAVAGFLQQGLQHRAVGGLG